MHRTSAVMCAASYLQFLSHQIQHEGMSSIRRSGYQNRTVFILYAIHVHGLQYAIRAEANTPWLCQHRASLMPYPSIANGHTVSALPVARRPCQPFLEQRYNPIHYRPNLESSKYIPKMCEPAVDSPFPSQYSQQPSHHDRIFAALVFSPFDSETTR